MSYYYPAGLKMNPKKSKKTKRRNPKHKCYRCGGGYEGQPDKLCGTCRYENQRIKEMARERKRLRERERYSPGVRVDFPPGYYENPPRKKSEVGKCPPKGRGTVDYVINVLRESDARTPLGIKALVNSALRGTIKKRKLTPKQKAALAKGRAKLRKSKKRRGC